jgi:UDP-2,3-diacylglucosamine hydrolase
MNEAQKAAADGPLAIICGGGTLPGAVAEAAVRAGRPVILFAVRGHADPAVVEKYPHHWFWFGKFGYLVRTARAAGCRDVVWIGTMVRPTVRELRPDWLGIRMLPFAVRVFRGGDDSMLSAIADMFEQHGFRLIGAHEIAPEILQPEGVFGARQPSAHDFADIQCGLAVLRATGPFDIGQAVVVAEGRVLAIEAAEGTDGMLAHVAAMRAAGRIRTTLGRGVLVKAPKPKQDRRFDLPAIGPRTVEGVARAGLAGLAVVAGSTIIAEPEQVLAAAERAKVFVVGIRDEDGAGR